MALHPLKSNVWLRFLSRLMVAEVYLPAYIETSSVGTRYLQLVELSRSRTPGILRPDVISLALLVQSKDINEFYY